MRAIAVIFALSFNTSLCFAHKVGNDKFCLQYTESHIECVYPTLHACNETLKSVLMFTKKQLAPSIFKGEDPGKKIEPNCQENPEAMLNLSI